MGTCDIRVTTVCHYNVRFHRGRNLFSLIHPSFGETVTVTSLEWVLTEMDIPATPAKFNSELRMPIKPSNDHTLFIYSSKFVDSGNQCLKSLIRYQLSEI
jgi:hypothetical protein